MVEDNLNVLVTHLACSFLNLVFFKRFYLFLFRHRGREGERQGEKRQCVVASCMPPTGDLARSPGMRPDWELNQQRFGLQPVLNPLSHTSQGKNKKFLT